MAWFYAAAIAAQEEKCNAKIRYDKWDARVRQELRDGASDAHERIRAGPEAEIDEVLLHGVTTGFAADQLEFERLAWESHWQADLPQGPLCLPPAELLPRLTVQELTEASKKIRPHGTDRRMAPEDVRKPELGSTRCHVFSAARLRESRIYARPCVDDPY